MKRITLLLLLLTSLRVTPLLLQLADVSKKSEQDEEVLVSQTPL